MRTCPCVSRVRVRGAGRYADAVDQIEGMLVMKRDSLVASSVWPPNLQMWARVRGRAPQCPRGAVLWDIIGTAIELAPVAPLRCVFLFSCRSRGLTPRGPQEYPLILSTPATVAARCEACARRDKHVSAKITLFGPR